MLTENKKVNILIRPHAVDIAFAITVHKIQGQTCRKLIVDLNQRPFKPRIDFHDLYVVLSRVRRGSDLRLMLLQPCGTSLHYLKMLKPAADLTTWMDAFQSDDGDGSVWSASQAKIHSHHGKRPQTTKDKHKSQT